jgi:hypothetical protein
MTLNEVIATAKDAGFDGVILEMIAHTYKLGAENEREMCAKVCDARYMGDNSREDMEANRCADAIRNRGQS